MIQGKSIIVGTDVAIPLRDGTTTYADVWRPEGAPPAPALLQRTPYLKELSTPPPLLDPRPAVQSGFCVVVQDVRGTGRSAGTFEPFVTEGPDGFDTVAWIAEQPWCDGRVGMIGGSYCGAIQWLAAGERPPALAAVAPVFAADQAAEGWSFCAGRREYGLLATWIAAALAPPDLRWLDDMPRALRDVGGLARIAPWSRAWFTEPVTSEYWRERSPRAPETIAIPAFLVSGWYDIFVGGTLRAYARKRHPWDRLVIGPWGHDIRLLHLVGDADLGSAGAGSAGEVTDRMLAFFEAVIEGCEPPGPPVRAYALGRRAWLDFADWPPPEAVPLELPLDGGGAIEVDPSDLPPSMGGRGLLVSMPHGGFGVRDQRPLTKRPDVLQLHSTPADADVLLAGPISVRLPVRASGGGARDWVVTMCLAAEEGRLENVCEGIAHKEAAADAVEIALGEVCLELPRGARLVLLVAGGSFPRWEPISTAGTQCVKRGGVLRVTAIDRCRDRR